MSKAMQYCPNVYIFFLMTVRDNIIIRVNTRTHTKKTDTHDPILSFFPLEERGNYINILPSRPSKVTSISIGSKLLTKQLYKIPCRNVLSSVHYSVHPYKLHYHSLLLQSKTLAMVLAIKKKAVEIFCCTSDTAWSPLYIMGPPIPPLLPLLKVFPFCCQTWCVYLTVPMNTWTQYSLCLLVLLLILHLDYVCFLLPMLSVTLPNLLAKLINAMQSWVVDQWQEVAIPQLLIGCFLDWRKGMDIGAIPLSVVIEKVFESLSVDDFQSDFE